MRVLHCYAARCVNLVPVVIRIAVPGARSAPRDTGKQPRALPRHQGQSPWLFGIVAVLLAGVPAAGHHSFAAYYFEEQSVTIEGEVVEFDYRAPHAWVYLMAPDAQGRIQRFSAEWANPRRLTGDGVSRDKLKAGDRVIITGSPGRTPSEFKIHLKRIRRPADGWEWGMRRNRR